MAFMEKIFNKQDSIDMDEFLNSLGDEPEEEMEEVDAYVKPISLGGPEDAKAVVAEIMEGNIVLLNIEPMTRRSSTKLKEYVGKIKMVVNDIHGDMARISETRILVTPAKVKIVKKR